MLKTNIVGNRYGELIVIGLLTPLNGRSRCLVICDCGIKKEVDTKNLLSGNTKTCGHTHTDSANNTVDIIGLRYGKLVVIRRSETEKNRARWVCKCDCGKYCTVTGKTLRDGKKRSCGCLRGSMLTDTFVGNQETSLISSNRVALERLYNKFEYQAQLRNYDFKLSLDEVSELVCKNCTYCGILPSQLFIGANSKRYVHHGIDRIDNTKGYIIHNCTTACGVCNNMKRALSQTDFINRCIKIAENFKKSAEMTDLSNVNC